MDAPGRSVSTALEVGQCKPQTMIAKPWTLEPYALTSELYPYEPGTLGTLKPALEPL